MQEAKIIFSASEKGWGDSPRAIEAELIQRGVPFRRQWLLPDGARGPDELERIAPGSEEARSALETADCIVSNTYLLQRFTPAPGATYLQTWHGTPLKRIGHDIRIPQHILRYEVSSREDSQRWDYLLAPNAFSVPILQEVFPGVEVLETGYPRNDVLLSADAEEIRRATREQLGLSADEVAVLYAPTFRDHDLSVRFGLDPHKLEPILPAGVVVLARSHVMTPPGDSGTGWAGWRDVTAWPDIADLYLAADVLITDYSSAMFDFAVTRKPMLFYTYDLEHYRDEARGFYFDFEAAAPGPLLRTPEEVARAIAEVDVSTDAFRERYQAFVERFCHLDDGRASSRVVDVLLSD